MATLEKIRSKSVFLIVIIAVALLAFILGDAITNGRNLFGNNTTVADAGGNKIDYTDYNRKYQELQQQLEDARRANPAQYANYDNQMLAQDALNQLIDEAIIDEAVQKTGVRTSDELLRFVLVESPQSVPEVQKLMQQLQQSGISVSSPQQAFTIIFSPQSAGLTDKQMAPFQRAWIAIENDYRQKLARSIYMSALASTVKANDLDIAAMKRDATAVANVKVAKKTYANIDEKKYPVSDDEIKKEYEKQKQRFAVDEETKQVSFIAVQVAPSDKDKAAANKLATMAVEQLKTKGEISKDLRKEGLTPERHNMRVQDIKNKAIQDFIASAQPGDVELLQGNLQGFQIVRMGNRETALDSIEVSVVQVVGKNLPNKVLAALESGIPADSLKNQFSADSVMSQPPMWLPLYTAEGKNSIESMGFTTESYNKLLDSNGYVILNEVPEGAILAKVTERKSPKQVVSYETIDYVIHPSEATLDAERAKLQKFLDANPTAAKFAANASKAGFTPQTVQLSQSSSAVPSGFQGFYPDSRAVVRWVMIDGEKGDVSKIYQSKDPANPMLYAVAVTDVYDEYMPWNNQEVKNQLTKEIRNSKAGDSMIKQYSSKKSVEEVAQAMGVEVQEVAELKAGRNGIVGDSKVVGRIMGSKPSQKVQLVKGDDGVYAYVINNVSTAGNEVTDEQLAAQFKSMHQINPTKLVAGKKKIKKNIYKFEQGE